MVREVKRPSFDDSLERIHDMRFECVQLNLNVLGFSTVPESLPSGKAGEIGATFWAYGLNLSAISGTFNTAHPDEAIRKAGMKTYLMKGMYLLHYYRMKNGEKDKSILM